MRQGKFNIYYFSNGNLYIIKINSIFHDNNSKFYACIFGTLLGVRST